MRQISTSHSARRGRGDLRLDRRPPARARARADRCARAPAAPGARAPGTPLRAADRRPGSAPRRLARRRARSRQRQPRARRLATAQLARRTAPARAAARSACATTPVAVALGLVRDQAGRLQVVEPALHAAPMRAHEPRPLRRVARDRAPAHHRRQPHHQLPDRRRVARRPLRVPEPEQVPLDRVRARLQPIVARRRCSRALGAPAPAARRRPGGRARRGSGSLAGRYQRRDDRRARASGCAIQRHRQRPKAPRQQAALRTRADARGTAGTGPTAATQARSSARRTRPSRQGLAIRPQRGYSSSTFICGRSPTRWR